MSRIRHLYGDTTFNNSLVLPEGRIVIDTQAHALHLHDGVTPGGYVCQGNRAVSLGPGPQTLQVGDTAAGFYGEVSAAALMTEAELSTALGLTLGVVANEATWLKFAYFGKTLFVAKRPLRHTVAWSDLYQLGLVYGVDSPGYNPYPSDQPVNQLRTVTKGTNIFNVRLMTGGNGDPSTDPGGEWNALMYPIHQSDPSGLGWGVNYTDSDLVIGNTYTARGTWCQETVNGEYSAYRLLRGYSSLTSENAGGVSAPSSAYGWRPVLELAL